MDALIVLFPGSLIASHSLQMRRRTLLTSVSQLVCLYGESRVVWPVAVLSKKVSPSAGVIVVVQYVVYSMKNMRQVEWRLYTDVGWIWSADD